MMLGRILCWLRRHQRLADFLWIAPLLVMFLFQSQGELGMPAYAVLAAALCLPLVWRRSYPRAVFAIIAAILFIQWAADIEVMGPEIAIFPALYTVAANCSLRWAIVAGGIVKLGGVLAIARWGHDYDGHSRWNELIPLTIFTAGTWILGIYISTRRAYMRSLEERADRLERERDTQARIAVAAERARIAREMHDVVSHSISVMVVQADGAGYAIETDKERAQRAMKTISATGRQALGEMRRLLGVLREDDDAGPYAPQPGVEQLNELVTQIKGAGLPAELYIEGAPVELPAGQQLAVYRVVQEGLTNVLKHGGPAAIARVTLSYRGDAVEIRVRDNGRGAGVRNDGRGHGLVGMRERVAMYGGTVKAGPRAGGGFEVAVRLPLNAAVIGRGGQ